MLSRLSGHLCGHGVAYIALFVALSGTAVAAAPLITGAKIEDGTLASADLRNRGGVYQGLSIQGIDLEANTLTGAEVMESSLTGLVHSGDPAGGDLAGTYPNPTLKAAEAWNEVGDLNGPPFEDIGVGQCRDTTNWANFGAGTNTAAFYKDPLGRVHLRGTVTQVNPCSVVYTIFILPVGYRPAAIEHHAVASNNAFGLATIHPDGRVLPDVSVLSASGFTTWFSLDGISFRAAN